MDYTWYWFQRSNFILAKDKSMWQGSFLPLHSRSNCKFTSEIYFELCVSQRYVKNFERNWNNSGCIKVDIFRKCGEFLSFTGVCTNKHYSVSCEKLNFSGKHSFTRVEKFLIRFPIFRASNLTCALDRGCSKLKWVLKNWVLKIKVYMWSRHN